MGDKLFFGDWAGALFAEPRGIGNQMAGGLLSALGAETKMTKSAVTERIAHRWYPRPVFFVADVNLALRFYIDMLGFEKSRHEGGGAGKVCQVNRAECEIILCEDGARKDKARLFVELTVDGLNALRGEIAERSIPSENSWWGYDVIKIVDPDGNELLFPLSE